MRLLLWFARFELLPMHDDIDSCMYLELGAVRLSPVPVTDSALVRRHGAFWLPQPALKLSLVGFRGPRTKR